MLPIKQSPLASYFDDFTNDDEDLNGLNFLDASEAGNVWRSRLDGTAKGLYDLPNDSWVLRTPWTAVGAWIDAYNGAAESIVVQNVIAKASGWPSDEALFLIRDSRNIVSLRFAHFAKHWESLFAAFDDGPLLMSTRTPPGSVFRFVPLGSILKAVLR